MKVLQRLWLEEGGFVISTEAIVILTMLICATVVGWQAVRVAVVEELADIADAIAALDQSYSFAGFQGHAASCSGSFYSDNRDFCDEPTASAPLAASVVALLWLTLRRKMESLCPVLATAVLNVTA